VKTISKPPFFPNRAKDTFKPINTKPNTHYHIFPHFLSLKNGNSVPTYSLSTPKKTIIKVVVNKD